MRRVDVRRRPNVCEEAGYLERAPDLRLGPLRHPELDIGVARAPVRARSTAGN
jgi:hypothetical protein